MNKTLVTEPNTKICVDVNALSDMLGVGRNTARKIGAESKADISIGRRKLYNVEKIRSYIDRLSGGDGND